MGRGEKMGENIAPSRGCKEFIVENVGFQIPHYFGVIILYFAQSSLT